MIHMSIAEIIGTIQAVETLRENAAKKRIDFPVPKGLTFFSSEDVWLYEALADTKVCPDCQNYEDMASQMGGFSGNFLRSLFPWLTVLDTGTIGGPGNGGDGLVHPNCRCRLVRYIGDPDKAVLGQKHMSKKAKEKMQQKIVNEEET